MVVATLAKKWAHDMASWRLCTKLLGAGHSETIVFLPGFTGSHEVWNPDFQALSQPCRLVLLDMLGFGHSPKPATDYTLDDHLGAIHRFQLRADALLHDTHRPVLIVQGRQDTIAPIGNVISAVDRLPNVWCE